jgi:hypothetical protein
MPAAYTHPAGHEIDFPAPGLFSIKMSDGRQGDVPLHVEIPSHEHRLYGALIMSTLGIPVPPEDLRTPDGGMMVWSESTDGGISFSELPKTWADALVYSHGNYKVFIDGPEVWVLNPAGLQLDVPIRGFNVPEGYRRAAGAGILQMIAKLQGLDLMIPDNDLAGPDGGIAQALCLSHGDYIRLSSGNPDAEPLYQHSQAKVYVEGNQAWIINHAGQRLDLPADCFAAVAPCHRRCYAAAVLQMVSLVHGHGYTIPTADLMGPDGGRAVIIGSPDREEMHIEYVYPSAIH